MENSTISGVWINFFFCRLKFQLVIYVIYDSVVTRDVHE